MITITAFLFLGGLSIGTIYILSQYSRCLWGIDIMNMKNVIVSGGGGGLPSSHLSETMIVIEPSLLTEDTTSPVVIPNCTSTFMEVLNIVLSPFACSKAPYDQECSHTVATIKGGCTDDTFYFRQPIASMELSKPFIGLLIGSEDNDETPMDLLMIGSHDPIRYDMTMWRNAGGHNQGCPTPKHGITYARNIQEAKVYVVDKDISRYEELMVIKESMGGFLDDDIPIFYTSIGGNGDETSSLKNWIPKTIGSNVDIHYSRIRGGIDYEVMNGNEKILLQQVWFIDFFYDWKGGWAAGGSLQHIIDVTLHSFSCYWHGGQGNLWRITGCWQRHYSFQTYSKIVCVNTKIDEARPILLKMEEAFGRTMTKLYKY